MPFIGAWNRWEHLRKAGVPHPRMHVTFQTILASSDSLALPFNNPYPRGKVFSEGEPAFVEHLLCANRRAVHAT